METEQKIRRLVKRWAYLNEYGEQAQCMNVNEVNSLIAELTELFEKPSKKRKARS